MDPTETWADVRYALLGLLVYIIGLCGWVVLFQSMRDQPGWRDLRLVPISLMPGYDGIWNTNTFEDDLR